MRRELTTGASSLPAVVQSAMLGEDSNIQGETRMRTNSSTMPGLVVHANWTNQRKRASTIIQADLAFTTWCSSSVLVAAAAAAEAVAAEAAVVTAAAGHTRPGPDQRPCACVLLINPLTIATAVVPDFSVQLLKADILLYLSPIAKTRPSSEVLTPNHVPPLRYLQQAVLLRPLIRTVGLTISFAACMSREYGPK